MLDLSPRHNFDIFQIPEIFSICEANQVEYPLAEVFLQQQDTVSLNSL